MSILVTGGAGYIGSHMVLALLEQRQEVVVLDNLSNGSAVSIARVENLAGRDVVFIEGDVRDRTLLDRVFREYPISDVLHFAGLKAVGESIEQPIRYYDNNVGGAVTLCLAMESAGVRRLIFSSSATVYGEQDSVPYHEGLPTGVPTNPYGRSKLMVEEMLRDLATADTRWSIALLRYFNPVGAHASGCIGEDPRGVPNNLVPFISQVAVGRLEALSVFGNDYPTADGTGVRDYIHVMDLVEGHLAAMQAIANRPGVSVWNLGTGRGYSVLDMIQAFERAAGCSIPFRVAPRRAGDLAQVWADASKAQRELGWRARRDLDAMVADAWRWQVNNPGGYAA
ncbi:UDP-glucose 4-epimerase GalE [Halomonas sp. JS92-SW72]|uniref:UDP-glucose 4-epimerase GalE n=1 Tax=Halomonas sp. JS92-SW72 TaxID=2306583 RepID=UPI000E5BA819|nr:UDP-glucose 4-epimerase GalE [Halomonas sp. JS92-SW72]AXY43978.1 UDP-glucose 4-epimerase GalE [Halomonas sp. JS92-SW72]